mgnify:CR=1 FL=1
MQGMSDEKWDKIIFESLIELYKYATPKVDINKLLESENPFDSNKYRLSQKIQDKILNNICKKYNITGYNINILKVGVYLSGAPSFNVSDYKKFNKLK